MDEKIGVQGDEVKHHLFLLSLIIPYIPSIIWSSGDCIFSSLDIPTTPDKDQTALHFYLGHSNSSLLTHLLPCLTLCSKTKI